MEDSAQIVWSIVGTGMTVVLGVGGLMGMLIRVLGSQIREVSKAINTAAVSHGTQIESLRENMRQDYHRLDDRMRAVEQGFARIDQRLETLERVLIRGDQTAN